MRPRKDRLEDDEHHEEQDQGAEKFVCDETIYAIRARRATGFVIAHRAARDAFDPFITSEKRLLPPARVIRGQPLARGIDNRASLFGFRQFFGVEFDERGVAVRAFLCLFSGVRAVAVFKGGERGEFAFGLFGEMPADVGRP